MNICKPNLAYITSILRKVGSKLLQNTYPTKLYRLKVTKNVECASYKYLKLQQTFVNQYFCIFWYDRLQVGRIFAMFVIFQTRTVCCKIRATFFTEYVGHMLNLIQDGLGYIFGQFLVAIGRFCDPSIGSPCRRR
jgi:hypothetical protein